MRRSEHESKPGPHRTKGEKANEKRMATVGTIYSVDRCRRTPQQALAALFEDGLKPEEPRPTQCHKHLWACLTYDEGDEHRERTQGRTKRMGEPSATGVSPCLRPWRILNRNKFLIGREEDCQLRPNSDLVSRHHCVFSTDDFTVRIRDLGSTNGTFVNNHRITGQVVLKQGDQIRIGKLAFEIQIRPDASTQVNQVQSKSRGLR